MRRIRSDVAIGRSRRAVLTHAWLIVRRDRAGSRTGGATVARPTPAADRGGQRPSGGAARAWRPISGARPASRRTLDLRCVGATGRADQARGAFRRLSVRPTRRSSATWPAAGSSSPDSVHRYARGSLVLAVYHELGGPGHDRSTISTRPEVKKIALANPETAPYGKAGKQALERAGLWEQLQPKIVMAESVRQALLYAQKGDAEAALVGRAIAGRPRGPVGRGRHRPLRPDHPGAGDRRGDAPSSRRRGVRPIRPG